MVIFKITGNTTIKSFSKAFKDEFGATLQIYDGRLKAEDNVKLVDIGAKTGIFECRANRTVGKFVEMMQQDYNLKVKVRTADDWVTVIDGLTLNRINDLPKQPTKTMMEEFVSYQRDKKMDDEIKREEITTSESSDYPTYEECVAMYPPKKGGERYEISEDGKTLTPSEALKGSLIVPEGVEILHLDGFYRNDDITSLILPDSIKEIDGGFSCNNLKFVRLSKNLKKLPARGFEGCPIEEIAIPEKLKIIPYKAFYETRLKTIKLPNCVEYILGFAFSSTDIEKIIIPESVKVVFDAAFSFCEKLKEVTILSKKTVVIPGAFSSCGEWDENYDLIPNFDTEKIYKDHELGNRIIGETDVIYEEINGEKTLTYVPNYFCGKLKIEEGTRRCKALFPNTITELWMPDSIIFTDYIDSADLRKVRFPASFENYEDWQNKIDISSEKLEFFNFPKGLIDLQLSGTKISELVIPEGVKEVSLYNMPCLKKLNLPSTLETLNMNNCPELECLNIPDNVSTLGWRFAGNCEELEEVKLSNNIKDIPKYAFSYCVSLKKIIIPKSVETIESQAFSGCINLTNVEIEGNPKISPSAFKDCPGYLVKTTGLTTLEWGQDGLPLVSLKFRRYFFENYSEEQARDCVNKEGDHPGIFVACGSNDFMNYPFDNITFIDESDSFDSFYFERFLEEDEEECFSLLYYGNMLYAKFDQEDYPQECRERTLSALETILDVLEDKRITNSYDGPEAIFEIEIQDDPEISDEEIIYKKRFRIFEDEDGNWSSEELD